MSTEARTLTLNIEANSPEDMAALLRQALYELDKVLPVYEGDNVAKRNSLVLANHLSSLDGRKTKGNMSGSLGSYTFELLHCSKQFFDLETQLLSQGYRFRKAANLFGNDFYEHPTLEAKMISGTPPKIDDYSGPTDPF